MPPTWEMILEDHSLFLPRERMTTLLSLTSWCSLSHLTIMFSNETWSDRPILALLTDPRKGKLHSSKEKKVFLDAASQQLSAIGSSPTRSLLQRQWTTYKQIDMRHSHCSRRSANTIGTCRLARIRLRGQHAADRCSFRSSPCSCNNGLPHPWCCSWNHQQPGA